MQLQVRGMTQFMKLVSSNLAGSKFLGGYSTAFNIYLFIGKPNHFFDCSSAGLIRNNKTNKTEVILSYKADVIYKSKAEREFFGLFFQIILFM